MYGNKRCASCERAWSLSSLAVVVVFVWREAGTVYVGCDNHQLYAVSPLSGLVIMSIPTGGAVQSSPAIGFNHALAVGSSDGRVYFVEG